MPLGRHTKIGIGWAALSLGGILSFYLAKVSIEKQRYDNMKARQRMKHANEGEYEPSYRKFSSSSQELYNIPKN